MCRAALQALKASIPIKLPCAVATTESGVAVMIIAIIVRTKKAASKGCREKEHAMSKHSAIIAPANT